MQDKTSDVHGAVSAAAAGAIMQRDASGRAQVADPAADQDIASKKYVDRRNVVYITTSQIWTVPVGVYNVDVFIVDAGQNGQAGFTGTQYGIGGGSGGNGGAVAYIAEYKVTPAASIPVVVGAISGGKSSFNVCKLRNPRQLEGARADMVILEKPQI